MIKVEVRGVNVMDDSYGPENLSGHWFQVLVNGHRFGEYRDKEMAERWAGHWRKLLNVDEINAQALDAARYRAWRAAVLNDDDDFIVNVGRALPEREKDDTLDSWEWDRAIDAAIAGSKA